MICLLGCILVDCMAGGIIGVEIVDQMKMMMTMKMKKMKKIKKENKYTGKSFD